MDFTAGGVGYKDKDFVEYDMDALDEEWLHAYNSGQNRLPERVFERLMWKLELACADTTEKTLRAAGKMLMAWSIGICSKRSLVRTFQLPFWLCYKLLNSQ